MKIEVGKKYWRHDDNGNRKGWGKVLANKEELGVFDNSISNPFIVMLDDGQLCCLKENGKTYNLENCFCDLYEEYVEPITRSIKGWILYDSKSMPLDSRYTLEDLMGCETDPEFYLEKVETNSACSEIVYGELSFKQLPEPEENIKL